MSTLNYPGDVRDSFEVDTYATNIYGDTMSDVFGYPLMTRAVEFSGDRTTVHVEVVGRPAKGVK